VGDLECQSAGRQSSAGIYYRKSILRARTRRTFARNQSRSPTSRAIVAAGSTDNAYNYQDGIAEATPVVKGA